MNNQDLINLSDTQAYKETDNLYFPYKNAADNCYGYWFSATHSSGGSALIGVNYKGELGGNGYNTHWGVRPVIHLKSEIGAYWNAEREIWDLQ